jgi:hypothetical protein
MRTLLSVIERVLASSFIALNRLHAFGLENFPATFFLPAEFPSYFKVRARGDSNTRPTD